MNTTKGKGRIFRTLKFANPVIGRTCGSYIIDGEGKRYLDFASGQISASVGHSHPKLIEAVERQIKKSINLGSMFLSDTLLKAADLLSELVPKRLEKFVFLNTGTEANEFALRLSKAYNERAFIAGFDRGYYGSSFYTGQLSRLGNKAGLIPEIQGVLKIPTPYCFRCHLGMRYPGCGLGCLAETEDMLRKYRGEISAFIVEPVISSGGMIIPPQDYFKGLSSLILKHEALLIVDESQTGMGRTGKWFAFEHWPGITPDIMVLAKGLGGGYPVSVVATTSRIEETALKKGFGHVSSHMNDPLGAAAALAIIKIIKEEGLLENAQGNGAYFKNRLMDLKKTYGDLIGDVRGLGLMLGVELTNGEKAQVKELTGRIDSYCFDKGLVFGYLSFSGIFRVCPPLTVSREEIDRASSIFEEALLNSNNA